MIVERTEQWVFWHEIWRGLMVLRALYMQRW